MKKDTSPEALERANRIIREAVDELLKDFWQRFPSRPPHKKPTKAALKRKTDRANIR